MAQQIKALPAKPDSLCFIPWNCMLEGENPTPTSCPQSPHTHGGTPIHTYIIHVFIYAHTYIHIYLIYMYT